MLMFFQLQASSSVLMEKLEWQDTKETAKVKRTWDEAKNYCEELSLLGQDDWRLPSIKELQTIIAPNRKKPAIKKKFKHTKNKNYWSSTPYIKGNHESWSVNFYRGYTQKKEVAIPYYVRCVRNI